MKQILVLIAVIALGFSGTAIAADAEAGKAKSATCVACHGMDGHSANPLWPNLAGQKDQYLIKQMKDFRDGKRSDPVMAPMADEARSQRAMIHLMLGDTSDARALVDNAPAATNEPVDYSEVSTESSGGWRKTEGPAVVIETAARTPRVMPAAADRVTRSDRRP